MMKFLRRVFGSKAGAVRPTRRARPSLEALEDRNVPASLLPGGIVSGAIASPSEVQSWTFPGMAGDEVELITTSTPTQNGFNAFSDVYSPSGSRVTGFWAGNNVVLTLAEDGDYTVQVRDVIDEMVEAARPDPLRIAVAAKVERDRATGEQRREQVERAGVVEPAVQEQGHLALAPLDAVEPEAADVQQSVVHGVERISLTRFAPFATGAGWRTLSSASSWGARPTSKCSTARRRC